MRFPSGLRALNHRDFRLFTSGQLISLVGTWMQSVAQSWLVLELTNSPLKLGIVGTLQFGPMLLFSFLAGAAADRLPKRRVILATQTALMLQAFVLAALAWTGHVRYWHVAVLAFGYGMATTLDMPTRQSFIVEMVGRQDLSNAIALNSAMFNGARMIGPAVAGLLVDRFGVAIAFGINGLSFIAVLIALAAMRAEGLPSHRDGSSIRQDILVGVRYAKDTPLVALILSLLLSISLFVLNHNVMVPLLARDILHLNAHGFGLLMAALGTGAVIGAFALAAFVQSHPPLWILMSAAVISSASILSLSAVRTEFIAAAILSVVGLSQIMFLASCNTTLQMVVPDRLRGRIMSLYAFVFAGVTPIGSFLMGGIAEWFGISAAYAVGGGIGLACVLGLMVVWWRASAGTGRTAV
ncbi:MAG TPA: MFS transporter [Candidatus Baltobacteraceae bacterium]|nr:MFS transporter [Candidatus Baltobacteraceae bacterium]HVP10076.1 MFS transporter [Phycisphaerae bacterium]